MMTYQKKDLLRILAKITILGALFNQVIDVVVEVYSCRDARSLGPSWINDTLFIGVLV